MKNQLLLIDDVDDLGRKGDIVSVKPGFARNFILPQKKGVIADANTLRMRARLQAERAQQAVADKEEAEAVARRVEGMELVTIVKLDPEGNMYGSVASTDIVKLFEKENVQLEKRNVVIAHPIKKVGLYELSLKLKEGIRANFKLKVVSDSHIEAKPVVEKPSSDE